VIVPFTDVTSAKPAVSLVTSSAATGSTPPPLPLESELVAELLAELVAELDAELELDVVVEVLAELDVELGAVAVAAPADVAAELTAVLAVPVSELPQATSPTMARPATAVRMVDFIKRPLW
jgi:hypothetical protein